jgi:tetratricopeptide (TPR) repeat protein
LATLLCDTGRLEQAQRELDAVASQGFAELPEDGDWMATMTLLADVTAELGDAERARSIYELLLPYQRANVVVGLAAVCLGATGRYLGRLAIAMGERAEAIELLEGAMERNRVLTAPIHLAHTQLDYARALGPGPRAGELLEAAQRTAQELELPFVARRGERVRRELGL